VTGQRRPLILLITWDNCYTGAEGNAGAPSLSRGSKIATLG